MRRVANTAFRPMLGIALILCACALAGGARAADPPSASPRAAKAPAPKASPAGTMNPIAAAAGLPAWTPPETYSVDMVMQGGGETFTMKRFISGERVRTEIAADGQNIVMIELGDEAGTNYTLMPGEKRAMKMSRAKMMEAASGMAPEAAAKDEGAPPDAKIEPLGDDTINGVAAKKYRITSDGGTVLAWFDAATSAPLRMASKVEGKDSVIEWKNLNVAPQPAKLYEIPKGFEVTDMDEMMAKMKSMKGGPGMGGMGALDGLAGMAGLPSAGGMGGGLSGMAQGAGQSFGSEMGSSLGGTLGASFGGPLGSMAGSYLGGKVGGWLGAKAVKAVTPGD